MSDDYVNPTYPAFPIFAFIGAFLVLTPLPWHLQAWNAGTCLYMFWVAAGCFYTAVNSIIWHDNAIDLAPHWCDFTTRLGMAIFIGIPASSLCINRRLYKIASSNTIGSSTKERRTAILIDLAIGLGLPILEIPLSYIVQGHRYDIYEGYGCLIALVNTPLSYVLVYTWPIILGIISAVYCVLTLRAFLRRRAEFAQFLSTSGPVASGMSINRYFRLMALATTELLFNLPFSTYGLYFNITAGKIRPYVSWDDLHFEFWAIGQIPSVLFRTDRTIVTSLELQRWLLVLCAILFFALFGFSQEAKKFYRDIFWKVAGVFGKHPQAPVSKMDSLPSYVKSEKMESSTPKPSWKRFFTRKSTKQSNGWKGISSTLPSFRKTDSVASSTVVSYSPYSSKDPKLAPYMSSYSSPPTPTTVPLSPSSPSAPQYMPYSPSSQSTTSTAFSSYSPTGAPRLEMSRSSFRTNFDKEYRPNSLLSIVPPPPPVPRLPLATQRIDEEQSEWDPSTPTTTTMSHRDDESRPWSDYSIAAATIASVEDGADDEREQEQRKNWPTPIYAWAPRTPTGSRRISAMF